MKAVFWAGVGTLFPFLMTITGAALVFLLKNQKEDGPCMGFAAGVMSAAAVFSMLLPAMRQEAGGWLTVTLGFALGAAMIAGVDAFLGRTQRLQGVSASAKRRLMMYAAITLHNIPEGMAVGLSFARAAQHTGNAGLFAAAGALAIGIGIQNFPEGAAVALPLHQEGLSRARSFVYGSLSGIVEPIFGVLVVLCASALTPFMPWLLSAAAGAMLYVVVEELIPEAHLGEHSHPGTLGVMAGFLVMMVLDTALG